ncbi:plasmid mobilization protein [Sphingobacterium endophyticum]|uniref:plasmid mobilization protein n=1 Tax=Sphingobacterium endophyticum TaxID=2546448 RepID=UPI001E3643F0|nr:plasmid mobilization relaxosome protein MobC [Sphingobacterium endophyticum]
MKGNIMGKEKSNRTRIIGLRLTEVEFNNIEIRWKASTSRKLSDYIRKCIFRKKIIMTYRNRSLDEFMEEMILLRKELNAIGNNFNQSVKRLHTIQNVSEFKPWKLGHELERKVIFNKIEEIKNRINQIAVVWLQ